MAGFSDLPRQFGRDLTCKENDVCDILPVGPGGLTLIKKKLNYRIKMAGLPFRRCIEITQNATPTAKGKSRALKSGSNQMADVRTAVRVRGKIGDKCLVMRLKFAVIKEFWF